MVEAALANLANSILGGGLAATAKKKESKKEEPKEKVLESESVKAPESDSISLKELSPEQKTNLELALVMSGMKTPRLKNLMKQDSIDSKILGAFADILGLPKTKTTPLEEGKAPKTETMPVPESSAKKDTTIKGEEAKGKNYTTKGEEPKSKGTVMEIPEEDLSRLIEMVANYDLEKKLKDPDFMSLVDKLAIKNKVHRRDVLTQLTNAWNAEHQKRLESDLAKHDAGRIDYEKKLKDPKLKEATEKAAEKYKAEAPDYKYDDVKAKREAEGEKYTGERYSGKPSEEELRKADDFVWKNAGRDYAPRLDRAQNKTSIYRPGK